MTVQILSMLRELEGLVREEAVRGTRARQQGTGMAAVQTPKPARKIDGCRIRVRGTAMSPASNCEAIALKKPLKYVNYFTMHGPQCTGLNDFP